MLPLIPLSTKILVAMISAISSFPEYSLPCSKNSSEVTTVDRLVQNSLSAVERGGDMMQAYCVKCRAKKEMKDAKSITMKNGRPATQGVCPTCGTKIFRIGKS